MESREWDAVIVGSGLAGLACALSLPGDFSIALVTKENLEDANSYLAQGGICVRRGVEDMEAFKEDTLRAGQYKNSLDAVETMVGESEEAMEFLHRMGVPFTRDEEGGLAYTKEAAHSISRILFCKDQTGKAILETLIDRVRERANIHVFENWTCHDLLVKEGRAWGVYGQSGGKEYYFKSPHTILATGGLGGMYKNTTNFSHIRGDGLAIAIRHGIKLKDMSYIQIHPTSFYEDRPGRKFLISESVRGEGGLLKNHRGQRFVDELLPRDVVSRAMFAEMEKEGVAHQWLDFSPIPLDIKDRFPHIYQTIKATGIDPERDLVPVVPAYHYTMGGIEVDTMGRTSMEGLYAIGEVACTGVHGKNRLASNSLLEGLVFGRRTAGILQKKPLEPGIKDQDFQVAKLEGDQAKEWIEGEIRQDEYEKAK